MVEEKAKPVIKTGKFRVLFMHFNGTEEVGSINTLYISFFQNRKNMEILEKLENASGKRCVFNDVYFIDDSRDPSVNKINYFINGEKRSINIFRTVRKTLKATHSFDNGYLQNTFSGQILVVPIMYDDDEISLDMVSSTSGIEDVSFENCEKRAFIYHQEEIPDRSFKDLKKMLQKKYTEIEDLIQFDTVDSLIQTINGQTVKIEDMSMSFSTLTGLLSLESPDDKPFEIPSQVMVNNVPFIPVANVETLSKINMKSSMYMFKALQTMAKHVKEDNDMTYSKAIGVLNDNEVEPTYFKNFEMACRGQTSISMNLDMKNTEKLKNYVTNKINEETTNNVVDIDADQDDNVQGSSLFNEERLNAELSSDFTNKANIKYQNEKIDIYLLRILPIFLSNIEEHLAENFGDGNFASALEEEVNGIYAMDDFATKYSKNTNDPMIDELINLESEVDSAFMNQIVQSDSSSEERGVGNCVTYANAYVIKDASNVESVRMFVMKFDYRTIKSHDGKSKKAEINTCAYSALLNK